MTKHVTIILIAIPMQGLIVHFAFGFVFILAFIWRRYRVAG